MTTEQLALAPLPHKDIYAALAEIIEELDPAVKDTENPYYSSMYADLNQILEMVKPLCRKHGVLMLMLPCNQVIVNEGVPVGMISPVVSTLCMVGLKITLRHLESGTEIETTFMLPSSALSAQQGGSALTFNRRYVIKTIFLMQDVDEDANVDNRPITGFAQVEIYIKNADNDKNLDLVYKTHIQSSQVLSDEEIKTLLDQCVIRREQLKQAAQGA